MLTALYVKYNVITNHYGTPHAYALYPGPRCQGSGPRPLPRPHGQRLVPVCDWLPTPVIALLSGRSLLPGRRSSWSTTGTPFPTTPTASLSPSSPPSLSGTKGRFSAPLPIKQTWSGIALVVFSHRRFDSWRLRRRTFYRPHVLYFADGRPDLDLFRLGDGAARFASLFWFWSSPFPFRPSSSTRSPSRCSFWLQESPVTFCRCSAFRRSTKATSSNCRS